MLPGHERGREKNGLALGEKLGLVVGRVVMMIRIAVRVGGIRVGVAVAMMRRMRLGVIVRRTGVAVGFGEQMHRQPRDVKHQRAHRQPADGGAEMAI